MLNKSIEISKSVLIIGVVAGLAIILLVGLLCGLVARPNNCIKKEVEKVTTTLTRPPETTSTQKPITNQESTSKGYFDKNQN